MRLPLVLLAAMLLALGAAAPARAAIAYEHHRAIWIAGDDGSAPKRLATGFEPHLVPGGGSVLYRNRSGTQLYSVPTAGGPRRHLLTTRLPGRLDVYQTTWRLLIDFSDDGRHALVMQARHKPVVADLVTGRARALPLPSRELRLSPDGTQVTWVRGSRRCEVAVRAVAARRVRSLRRVSCRARLSWDAPGIAVADSGRIAVLDPATGAARRLLSTRREVGVAGMSASGAWQIVALPGVRHPVAAWLLRPDGSLVKRPLRQLWLGASIVYLFTPDDQAVLVPERDGTLARIALADGARHPLPIRTDGPFDTL